MRTDLVKYAASRMLQYRIKQALSKSDVLDGISKYKSNLVLPGLGAAAGGIYSALTNDAHASLKEKLKRIIRNASIGAGIGGVAELGRLGYAQKAHNKITDTMDSARKLIHEKTGSFYKKKMAGLSIDKSHLILPGIGAGVSSIATLIGMRKSKDSLKNKLKRLMRNAALGATLGTGAELVRTGTKNLLSPKGEIDGGAIVDSNFVDD